MRKYLEYTAVLHDHEFSNNVIQSLQTGMRMRERRGRIGGIGMIEICIGVQALMRTSALSGAQDCHSLLFYETACTNSCELTRSVVVDCSFVLRGPGVIIGWLLSELFPWQAMPSARGMAQAV